ncbi:MAG TPA: amino acid adenylation domain-containing protein [Micromonospora sp.]|nr:amino acid adenylation domain-containing protein [Micromonospora sp.]
MTGDTYLLPASSTQRRLWLIDRLEPGSPAYNILWSVRLTGPLRVPALESALAWLISRHEALRTTFTATDGEPIQVVNPPWPVQLPVTDLSNQPDELARKRLDSILDELGRAPFNLADRPLLRLRLIRRAAEEHLLVIVVHHIIADGWSFGTIFDELAHAYQAAADDRQPSLPPPPIQYGDFAVWQREQLERDAFADDLDYWRAELAGAPTLLDLPTDRPRPAEQTSTGGLLTFDLPQPLADGVRRLARDAGTTVFAVLLAAFQSLLHRLSGQPDLLVGVPVSGRSRPEIQQVVGFFANTLALRARFADRTTFRAVLDAARAAAIAAQSRQDVPFEQIIELLAPQRSLAYTPVVQVMFALEEPPVPRTVAGLRIAPELRENGDVKFDLTLTVEQRADGLRGRLTYRRELFDHDRISRLRDQYRALLTTAVAAPGTRISELPLLTDEQLRRLQARWREERLAPSGYESVADLLNREMKTDPEAVAVASSGESLSYQQLIADSNRLAHLLRRHAVGVDVPVGLCMSRRPAMVTALLAIWKAGGGFLPLDPDLPVERLLDMAAEAAPPVIITDRASRDRIGASWPVGTVVCCLDDEPAALAAQPATPPAGTGHPDALAYLLYTSGSTGRPKAVAVTHGSVVNLLVGMNRLLNLSAADRVAAITTPAFDISMVELVLPLLVDARVEMIDTETARDAVALRRELTTRGVTVAQATPATWRMLAAAGGAPPGVRLRISGGEALTRDLADALGADGATVINGYGPSETTIYSTAGRIGTRGPVDLGAAMDNTRLYLLDPAGQPVPVGVIGELHIGGLGVARGYHERPGLTAASFRPDPFSSRPGARLYATGDLARSLADGRLEYVGRSDHQVKVRGYRIELGEIEAALREQPEVRDAVVNTWRAGDEDVRLVAYVVPTDDPARAAALWPRLRPALARRLPEYMLPAALTVLDRLPRTASGKIDRRALPEPDWRNNGAAATPAPPRNETEERLTALWCDVLGRAEVGIHDNFFALGGHSLTATRMIARIRATFGTELALRSFFAAPTIAELADLIVHEAVDPAERAVVDRIAPARSSPERLLASIDSLSDGEIDELLESLIAEEEAG